MQYIEQLISHPLIFINMYTILARLLILSYPPASKTRKEVVNLTERKNLHTPIYGVKEFVCLSVCLSVCLYNFLNNRH